MNLEPKDGDFQSMVKKMAKQSSVNVAEPLSEQIKAQEESAKAHYLGNTQEKAQDSAQIQIKTKIKPQARASQATATSQRTQKDQRTQKEDLRPSWPKRLTNIVTTTLAVLVFFAVLMLWAFFKECLKHYWIMLNLDAWEAVFIFLGFMGVLLLIGLVDHFWKKFKQRRR